MRRLLHFFTCRPWLWLLFLLATSLLAATQLGELKVRISAEEMLLRDDPLRAQYEEIAAAFGDEEIVLVVASDPLPLDAQRIGTLRDAVHALAALPFVGRVDSLFSVPHVKSVDGYLDKQPYLPDTGEVDGASVIAAASGNPLLLGTLVSADGSAVALAVVLNDAADQVEDDTVVRQVDAVVAHLAQSYERAYAIGFPQVRHEIAQRIFDEQLALLPYAIVALLAALYIMLRQALDIVTPLITAGVSILWTYGVMGWVGLPVNVLTSTVPILLLVVGSTEDVHLLAEFRNAQRHGHGNIEAIAAMGRKVGRTVLLTFITTCIGFLSVGLSGIEALAQFGMVAALGLLFNFVATIIFIPAALTIAGHWQLDGKVSQDAESEWPARYWQQLRRRRWQIALATSLVVLIALTGIPRISLSHTPADSLIRGSPVADELADLNHRFAGLESFSVVIESGIQDTFLHARYLGEVVELQRFIRQLMPAASVTAFPDYLVLLNNAFLESDDAGVPSSNDEIAELMLFLDHERVSGYITEDYARTRIIVRHDVTQAAEIDGILQAIREFIAAETDPGLRASITGDTVLTLSAARSMIFGQLQSVLLILTLFVLIVGFIFTDLRVGLVAAAPNLIPLILLFGLMGYAGIPLNIGTAMTAAIALGIAVDDTLHFMLRYNQALRRSCSQVTAMHDTLRDEALPVLSTSVALIAGFLVFTLSGFTPVMQFGVLSAFVIATALLADFVLTPLLVSSLRLVTLWDLLSSRVRQQVIPNSPLFRGMRRWQIRKFVLSSTLLEFAPGDTIFRHGDDSTAMFVVMNGAVEITVPSSAPGKPAAVVRRFTAGEVFGDVAVLADEPRKTDAVALTSTTLLVLSREAITNVTHLHPFLASRLFLNLARDVSCRWVGFISRVRSPESRQAENDDK